LTVLKSIVVGLILANVGYFLWSRGIASTPEPVLATPSLQLASEAPGGAASAVPTAGGSAPEVSAPDTSTPAAGAPPSTLSAASSVPPIASTTPVSAPPDSSKRCVSVGPFRDVSEAARAAGTLRGSGHDPRQRVADGEVWAGVWVYLPLPPTPDAASQVLDKLKAGGIDDALEMPGPNDTSVVSLGLFSEPKRAQARVAQAQALALNATVADRKRNGNVYWIDIDLKPTESTLNTTDLQGESSRIVRLEVKSCPAPSAQR
jgi:hypothetical protein